MISEFHGNTAADNRPDTPSPPPYPTNCDKDSDITDLEAELEKCLDLKEIPVKD